MQVITNFINSLTPDVKTLIGAVLAIGAVVLIGVTVFKAMAAMRTSDYKGLGKWIGATLVIGILAVLYITFLAFSTNIGNGLAPKFGGAAVLIQNTFH